MSKHILELCAGIILESNINGGGVGTKHLPWVTIFVIQKYIPIRKPVNIPNTRPSANGVMCERLFIVWLLVYEQIAETVLFCAQIKL